MSDFPRRDKSSGWRHVDIRVNRDGTMDILTTFTLCPLGNLQGVKVKQRHTNVTEAIRDANAVEEYLTKQEPKKAK